MATSKDQLLHKIVKYGYKYELTKSADYKSRFDNYVNQYDALIGGGKPSKKSQIKNLSIVLINEYNVDVKDDSDILTIYETTLSDLYEKYVTAHYNGNNSKNQIKNSVSDFNNKHMTDLIEQFKLVTNQIATTVVELAEKNQGFNQTALGQVLVYKMIFNITNESAVAIFNNLEVVLPDLSTNNLSEINGKINEIKFVQYMKPLSANEITLLFKELWSTLRNNIATKINKQYTIN